ncbi:MAG: Rrf2 family transcriptional regulator [Ignavibacteria bacterium]|nr:Rrf2 family transcriptional regulator [Ignavibacteria bacterium]
MLQLSKKVEYGLIALRHMAMRPAGQVFTAKELAAEHNIPYELLAKVLQKLARANVVRSLQGVRGGYSLSIKPSELTVSNVIQIIENEKPMIAECYIDGPDSCSIYDNCSIRKPLGKVQRNLNLVFDRMTIQEII